ncbi:MAG: hypothetical protein AAGL90_02410 [Pseudomonadota bacterium]
MRRIVFCLFFLSLVPVAGAAQAQSDPPGISGVATINTDDAVVETKNVDVLAGQADEALLREEYQRAASLFIGACLKTSLRYCDRAQSIIDAESEISFSPDLQIILYHKACLYGRDVACQALKAFVARADAACVAGDAVACVKAGTSRVLGKGIGNDPAGGAQDFARACALGHRDACLRYAGFLADGWHVARDPSAAKHAFQASCAETHAQNCALAGLHYASGHVGVQDRALAKAFFDQGCAYGDPFACEERAHLDD